MQRPLGVTIMAAITVTYGLFQIGSGIAQLMRGPQGPWSLTVGWFGIVLGLVVLALGFGVFRGSSVARIIVTIAYAITIATTIYGMTAGLMSAATWYLAVPGILAVAGIILLWMPSSNAYFKRS